MCKMINKKMNIKVSGKDIFIQILLPQDVTKSYVDWMNDEEVTQFLESRGKVYTLEDIEDYVQKMFDSGNDYLFGIFLKNTNEHIGNIKIGGINPRHKFAEVGLILGPRDLRGKGYGSQAISLVTKYALGELNLNKLLAGIYENNIGSYKAFMKVGYREVGRFNKHRFYNGYYVDEILVEKGKS